ncbi:molybdenum cofactor guanylyltransferase [Humibacter sp. RRB41]|uniref:molybdenum cofactor guanylyltransferase n=1 Tax=Humibacter sp. RRB41 TaxID=2919946 RepID=UPI001FAA9676|nr:NTP transferase domain-containing protein [Humibacter sp. RRB41]
MTEFTNRARADHAPTCTDASSRIDAIILAGGRASRLDGIDKAALIVGGTRLVDRAIAAAGVVGADRIVLVGPQRARTAAPDSTAFFVSVREDPPFGGPVAALAAGLSKVTATLVLLLAADLPHVELAGDRLAAMIEHVVDGSDPEKGTAVDGVVLVDEAGRDQWLTGIYRAESLRSAIGGLSAGSTNASLHAVMRSLRLERIPDHGTSVDIDTWDDVDRFGAVDPTTGGACVRPDEGETNERHHPR